MDDPPTESIVAVNVTLSTRALLASLAVVPSLLAAAGPTAPVAAAATAAGPDFHWSQFLGPFHMVFLHLPIGFLALASAIEVWAAIRPFDGIRKLIGIILGLSLASGSLTAVLGLLRANGGEYAPDTLTLHRNTGLALVLLTAVTWGLHGRVLRRPEGSPWIYRAAMTLTLVVLTFTGHQGGTLTHGRGFLSEGSPEPLRRLIGELEPGAAPAATASTTAGSDAEVRRLLEAKCLACHGPEKQKGKFRVDQRESLLKGGSSGEAAVVPGDPGKSHLLRLVMLPRNHEDAMPPEGKEPLTDAELLALTRWIQAGAK